MQNAVQKENLKGLPIEELKKKMVVMIQNKKIKRKGLASSIRKYGNESGKLISFWRIKQER